LEGTQIFQGSKLLNETRELDLCPKILINTKSG